MSINSKELECVEATPMTVDQEDLPEGYFKCFKECDDQQLSGQLVEKDSITLDMVLDSQVEVTESSKIQRSTKVVVAKQRGCQQEKNGSDSSEDEDDDRTSHPFSKKMVRDLKKWHL